MWSLATDPFAFLKDDYETTEAFIRRKRRSIIARFGDPDRISFEVPLENISTYNADTQTLTIPTPWYEIDRGRHRYAIDSIGLPSSSYTGQNAFGATAKVNVYSRAELTARIDWAGAAPEVSRYVTADLARKFRRQGKMYIMASYIDSTSETNREKATISSPSEWVRHETLVDLRPVCAYIGDPSSGELLWSYDARDAP